jgi:DNA repair protein RecN (Recombination protein N)
MIHSLRIKNLATIEDLELNFKEGFSILTGETGAGKSIIIDGIKLILGEKASPELIRTGMREATIEAIFHIPLEKQTSEELAFLEDGEFFLQRQIPQEGSGRAYVNGVLVPIKKLKEISPALVDIYGQNDHIFLLQLENHLHYLDQYLDLTHEREEISRQAQKLRNFVRQRNDLETRKRERERRLDFLSFQIKEIENAQLRPSEWEELSAERNILKNAEKIATLVEKALDFSHLQENSVSAALAKLQEIVRELSRYDQVFQAFNESLNQSTIAVRELSDSLIKFKEKQNLGPERLEELEERLSVIEKLRRKYGESIEDILLYLAKIKQEHSDLLQSEEMLADLEAEIRLTFAEYKASAEKLSRLRKEGAKKLETQVEKEIAHLGMKRARFQVKISTDSAASLEIEKVRDSGLDDVEFLISPNPGEELRPLRKIASGGELSRIMLALKTIGKEKGGLKTLIFDEIDSGIGGKTAECIAEKLLELSKRHQVICITHLPQIASFAPHHYRIEKKMEKERTYTTVKELAFEERVTEISRLLSGSRITPTSLQNAKEMLLHNLKDEKGGSSNESGSIRRRKL